MGKTSERRLVNAIKFLKSPNGSTIPEIIHALHNDEPKMSLKCILQTLRDCMENKVITKCDGRYMLKLRYSANNVNNSSETKKSVSPDDSNQHKKPHGTLQSPGSGPISGKIRQKCGPKGKAKSKPKAKPKPKPKAAKSKAKPKPKAKCKPKPKPKCPKKKPKIQPYCKKPKKCADTFDQQ